jgi:hypothetical protein
MVKDKEGTHHIAHIDKQPVKTTCSLSLDILCVWTVSCQGARVWTVVKYIKCEQKQPTLFRRKTKINSHLSVKVK